MKLLKRIVEFIFIFLLPLIIILFCSSYKKSYIYDNDKLKSETKELSFDIPFNNYKDPKYTYIIKDFNIWNENWGLGYLNSSGIIETGYSLLVSLDYIPVISSQTYYLNFPYSVGSYGVRIAYYDINKSVVSVGYVYSQSITIPSNVYYMKFNTENSYGSVYNSDICINISVDYANGYYKSFGEELILDLNTDYNYGFTEKNINYSFFGQIKNFIYDIFNIQDSTISNIIYCYLSFIIIMLIVWYSLYVPLDLLFGLLLRRLSYYK